MLADPNRAGGDRSQPRRPKPKPNKSVLDAVVKVTKKVQQTDVVKKGAQRAERQSQVRDTKSDADRARSQRRQTSRTQRKAVRDTYAEQTPARRRQLADAAEQGTGPSADEIKRFHRERVRVEGYKRAADRYLAEQRAAEEQADRGKIAPDRAHTAADLTAIRKGLRVENRQARRDFVRGAVEDTRTMLDDALRPRPAAKEVGVDEWLGSPVSAVRGALFGKKDKIVERKPGATSPGDFTHGTLDATSKVLEQLSRTSSASAGAALAAIEGRNVVSGALEGLTKNDKSYQQVAEKLGLKGTAANVVGLVGDIALDPATYASFGFKAPAEAAELTARRKLAREFGGAVKKAAKKGDDEAVARIHAEWSKRLEQEVAKASRLESKRRGVQVGVRLPGGRGVSTKGRVTAKVGGATVGRAAEKAGQNRTINAALRTFSPAQRPVGDLSRAEWEQFRQARRASDALGQRVAREGADLGRAIRDAVKGKDKLSKVRAIVDGIEEGNLDGLDHPLRDIAQRVSAYTDRVAARFEQETGKPLRLAETVLAPGEADEAVRLVRQVMDARLRRLRTKAQTARADAERAGVRNETLRKFGDPRRNPMVREQEQTVAAADRALRTAVDDLARARRDEAEAVSAAKLSEASDAPTVRRARADLAAQQKVVERLRAATARAREDVAHGTGRLEGADRLRRRQLRGRIVAAEGAHARLSARAKAGDLAAARQLDAVNRRLAALRTSLHDATAPPLSLVDRDVARAALEQRLAQGEQRVTDLERAFDAELARTAGVDPKAADRLLDAQRDVAAATSAHGSARAAKRLAGRELAELVRSVSRATARDAEFAARRAQRLDDAERAVADAQGLADRIASVDHPLSVDEERRLVSLLNETLDAINAERVRDVARRRVDEFADRVLAGEEGPEWDDLRRALNAEGFHARKASDLRAAGNLSGATAAARAARAARERVAEHRADLIDEAERVAAGENHLTGRAARARAVLERLAERTDKTPPVGYVPRQLDRFVEAITDPAVRRHLGPEGLSKAKAGPEVARVRREPMAELRDQTAGYSEDLPVLMALYGSSMGRRMAAVSLHRAVRERFAIPPTAAARAEREGVTFMKVGDDGTLTTVTDPKAIDEAVRACAREEATAAAADRPPEFDYVLVPDAIAKELGGRLRFGDDSPLLSRYDRLLRAWKSASTILRPGFFATTLIGNSWQTFLADAGPQDWARAWAVLGRLRAEGGAARRVTPALRHRIVDALAPDTTYVVEGQPRTLADLIDEATDAGAARLGSRIGDITELSLERQGVLRSGRSPVTWLGQLAEDMDDMTRISLYIRGRTKLGMTPEQATKYSLANMIDYGDLSDTERRIFKRIMPFYVFTSRNVPMQLRRVLARPGKLANMEKVREALANESGLPDDWQRDLTEADQERMPFPVPGLRSMGHQVFDDLRLPVQDLARPMQLVEGAEGAGRMLERYVSDVGPAKVPLELFVLNRRLDYDRAFDDGPPPAAGALARAAGLGAGEYVDPRTGRRYEGVNARLDYALRALSGSLGAFLLNQGRQVPDRSNIPTVGRNLATFAAGQGISAPDPREAGRQALGQRLHDLFGQRDDMERRPGQGPGTIPYIRKSDEIEALNDRLTKLMASMGYPDAQRKLPAIERRELRLAIEGREPIDLRAFRARLQRERSAAGLP